MEEKITIKEKYLKMKLLQLLRVDIFLESYTDEQQRSLSAVKKSIQKARKGIVESKNILEAQEVLEQLKDPMTEFIDSVFTEETKQIHNEFYNAYQSMIFFNPQAFLERLLFAAEKLEDDENSSEHFLMNMSIDEIDRATAPIHDERQFATEKSKAWHKAKTALSINNINAVIIKPGVAINIDDFLKSIDTLKMTIGYICEKTGLKEEELALGKKLDIVFVRSAENKAITINAQSGSINLSSKELINQSLDKIESNFLSEWVKYLESITFERFARTTGNSKNHVNEDIHLLSLSNTSKRFTDNREYGSELIFDLVINDKNDSSIKAQNIIQETLISIKTEDPQTELISREALKMEIIELYMNSKLGEKYTKLSDEVKLSLKDNDLHKLIAYSSMHFNNLYVCNIDGIQSEIIRVLTEAQIPLTEEEKYRFDSLFSSDFKDANKSKSKIVVNTKEMEQLREQDLALKTFVDDAISKLSSSNPIGTPLSTFYKKSIELDNKLHQFQFLKRKDFQNNKSLLSRYFEANLLPSNKDRMAIQESYPEVTNDSTLLAQKNIQNIVKMHMDTVEKNNTLHIATARNKILGV